MHKTRRVSQMWRKVEIMLYSVEVWRTLSDIQQQNIYDLVGW